MKKLEETLNLPSLQDALRDAGLLNNESEKSEEMNEEENYNNNPDDYVVIGINDEGKRDHETSMDKLFDESLMQARKLMDMGDNIDVARAGRIYEIGHRFYETALNAKNQKRDAQLKSIQLSLNARKVINDEKRTSFEIGEGKKTNSEEIVLTIDRNALLKKLRENNV